MANDNIKNRTNIQHPLFGISFKNWIKILEKNGGFDKEFFYRAAFITLGSIFTIPSRFLFKIRYQSKINNIGPLEKWNNIFT